jgi:hypothetical protein
MDYGDERKRTTDEMSKIYDGIKTRVPAITWDEQKRDLITAFVVPGIQVA